MSLVSICFVGKDNEPLYLRDFDNNNNINNNGNNNDNNINNNNTNTNSNTLQNNPVDESESNHDEDPFGFFESSSSSHHHPNNNNNNNKNNNTITCSLHYQFLMHASLDRFEELTGPGPSTGHGGGSAIANNRWRTPGSTGNDAMWVGLLCPVDDFRVYGYLTTTNIKLIGVVSVKDDHSFGQDLLGAETSAAAAGAGTGTDSNAGTGSSSAGNGGSNHGGDSSSSSSTMNSSGNSSKREAELKTMFVSFISPCSLVLLFYLFGYIG